jgi:uncharacterized protein YjbI with pentapeptide repeats
VILQGANLQKATLQGANLQEARLEGANLQKTNLVGAKLQKVVLVGANLQKALLWNTKLQEAVLWGANLQEAKLWNAKLQRAQLVGANLHWVDLRFASLQGAFFFAVRLDRTEMDRTSLGAAIGEELAGDYPGARDAYLRLKQNFDDLGDYAASSWAYRKERRMEKLEALQEARKARQKRDWKGAFRHSAKVAGDQLVELVCDYGESFWRVLAWMLLVILGFAAYYQVSHAVVTSSQDAATSLWDHLIFSLGAFTTLQPARLQAARPGVELLTTIQAIIGISLAGLLGFVAGNRIRRL